MHWGKGIKESTQELSDVIWVSGTEWLGQLLARRPPTLYFGYIGASHGAGVYSSRTVCLVYLSACAQTCLGHP